VHISTADWPLDGDLRESCSPYDKNALLKESRVHDQATQRPFGSPCHPQTYHSMRRWVRRVRAAFVPQQRPPTCGLFAGLQLAAITVAGSQLSAVHGLSQHQ
jgi:hypothetical protein